MNLKDIIAISGEGGLFKFVAQGKNAMIVEHLETAKRTAAHGTAKVNSLEDIAIFTKTEEVPLGRIFDKIFEKENGGQAIDPKSSSAGLNEYFEEILPDFDHQKVYTSDIKKIVTWYNFLQRLNLLVKDEPEDEKPDKKGPVKEKDTSKSGEDDNEKS
ncbi:MAG TPA: DUF5606 domain-containing protein [Bacteroidales bacterium]|nr:DUF5606 domain-containing protein [Bacteroidales bacterium]